jgi:type III restriction enzyme
MKLLDIQEQKIEQVVELLSEDRFNNKKPLYFQSPTGSGKTKMLARIIEEYKISNPTDKFLFIVASISTGGIEKQNYFSLKECERNGFNFKVEHISSGLTQPIKPSYLTDVLTIGEASFKNKSLLFEDHLLEEYLQKVYDSNKKIIFIRDEAHIGTKIGKEDSQNLSRLNKYFDKILYLSATLENFQDKIKVREAVEMTLIEAQENKLIKNYVILNNDGQINKTINEKQLFEYGCDKLNYLKTNVYPIFSKKLDRVFNPALLVQISNVEQGENQIKEIVEVCEKKNLTYAFALDKSGDSFQASGTMYKNKKIKREDLQKNDSDIDVIIFKYSVATG